MSSVGSFVHGGGGFLALWVRERWRRSFERFRLVGLIQLIFAERVKTFVRWFDRERRAVGSLVSRRYGVLSHRERTSP